MIQTSKQRGALSSSRSPRRSRIPGGLACFAVLVLLLLSLQMHALEPALTPVAPDPASLPDAPSQSLPCSITGTVVDRDGAFVAGATVTLTREGQPPLAATTGADGRFNFVNIPAGSYTLAVHAAGFAPVTVSGTLSPGQTLETPDITLTSASTAVDVQVTASQEEIAQAQIQMEEKQRILGIIPNFYVVYDPKPVPLNSRQKFELAWKTVIDPTSFASAGIVAGIQQAQNDFSGYGQGAAGYGKRFGASYGNVLIGSILGNAVLPSLLHQDPRYFYKGTGSRASRTWYALRYAVLCKGDNFQWQVNYSGILGTMAASGISNLYYPAANRNGFGLTVENTVIGMGGTAASNLFQEFLIPWMTTHGPHSKASKSSQATKP